jgi:type II secretory pathway component PulM
MKAVYRKYLATVALIWAGCLILLFLLYMLVIAPQQKSKSNTAKQLTETKQKYDQTVRATKPESGTQLREEIQRLKGRLQQFVIEPEQSADLTFDISQIAKNNQVSSFSIRSRDQTTASKIPNCNYIEEKQIYISFAASFDQFARFLNALERNEPTLFVDRFTITRSDQDDSSHEVSMDLTVFVRKESDS